MNTLIKSLLAASIVASTISALANPVPTDDTLTLDASKYSSAIQALKQQYKDLTSVSISVSATGGQGRIASADAFGQMKNLTTQALSKLQAPNIDLPAMYFPSMFNHPWTFSYVIKDNAHDKILDQCSANTFTPKTIKDIQQNAFILHLGPNKGQCTLEVVSG